MTTTKQTTTMLLACLALSMAACSDDPDDGGGDNPPAKPTPGAQIDRMGRPAVNTALNKTFTEDGTRDPAEDAYNGDSAKGQWDVSYQATFGQQLAVLDALDRICGNQLLAGATAAVGRYNTLAGALTDDELYVNSGSTTCGQYLAVEANATNAVPNQDCGGRKLDFDVILTTYSVLAAGALTGVDDTITNDSTFNPSFPYLGTAN